MGSLMLYIFYIFVFFVINNEAWIFKHTKIASLRLLLCRFAYFFYPIKEIHTFFHPCYIFYFFFFSSKRQLFLSFFILSLLLNFENTFLYAFNAWKSRLSLFIIFYILSSVFAELFVRNVIPYVRTFTWTFSPCFSNI